MLPKIQLKPITVDNWKSCAALRIAPDQVGFVPSTLYSIAESQFYPDAISRGIYNEEDQLVGYALWGRDVFTDKWKIFRIMIDQTYQHQGYGKRAMQAILKQISKEPNGNEVLICYQSTNQVARSIYTGLGFVEQETDADGKVTALLKQDIS